MKGITFKGKPPIAFEIVGKYKAPKGKLIGKTITAVQVRKLKTIPLWERGFPKFMGRVMGKKAQAQLTQVFAKQRQRAPLKLEFFPSKIKAPKLSIKPSFKTRTPIAGGAALLFPRYAPRIPSRFISPTTTAFFPIIKTEVLQATQIKLDLQQVIKPISLIGGYQTNFINWS